MYPPSPPCCRLYLEADGRIRCGKVNDKAQYLLGAAGSVPYRWINLEYDKITRIVGLDQYLESVKKHKRLDVCRAKMSYMLQ